MCDGPGQEALSCIRKWVSQAVSTSQKRNVLEMNHENDCPRGSSTDVYVLTGW